MPGKSVRRMSTSRCRPQTPLPATIAAEPQNITIDLARSAMIVVDMQNDFCAPGGWVDWLGADLSPERAPIKPLQRSLPALRANGVPIIWLNWGNRPDRKNLPPTILYVFNPDGNGIGIGGELPGQRRASSGEGQLVGGRRR